MAFDVKKFQERVDALFEDPDCEKKFFEWLDFKRK